MARIKNEASAVLSEDMAKCPDQQSAATEIVNMLISAHLKAEERCITDVLKQLLRRDPGADDFMLVVRHRRGYPYQDKGYVLEYNGLMLGSIKTEQVAEGYQILMKVTFTPGDIN